MKLGKRMDADFGATMDWEMANTEDKFVESLSYGGLSNENTNSTCHLKSQNDEKLTVEDMDMDEPNEAEDGLNNEHGARGEAASADEELSKKKMTVSTEKRKTGTMLDFVTLNPKASQRGNRAWVTNRKEAPRVRKAGVETTDVIKDRIDWRNVHCPIPGCGNRGGKGFRRNGITKHLSGQHSVIWTKLVPTMN